MRVGLGDSGCRGEDAFVAIEGGREGKLERQRGRGAEGQRGRVAF